MEEVKAFFVENIIRKCNSGKINVMLVDHVTLHIIDSLFTTVELGRERIYDVNLITNERCRNALSDATNAIYFLMGNVQNVLSVIRDIDLDEPIYRKVFLVFTTRLNDNMMRMLASSKAMPFIQGLWETSFYCAAMRTTLLSTFDLSDTECITRLVKVLGVTPLIQSFGSKSSVIAHSLIVLAGQNQRRERPLMIVDRYSVPISPLLFRMGLECLLVENMEAQDRIAFERSLSTNNIWLDIRAMLFPDAISRMSNHYKPMLSAEGRDNARKSNDLNRTVIKFISDYAQCVERLAEAKKTFDEILPFYTLQQDIIKTTATTPGAFDARINTLMNHPNMGLKQRFIVFYTMLSGRTNKIWSERAKISMNALMQLPTSRPEELVSLVKERLFQNRITMPAKSSQRARLKPIIYCTDAICGNEICDDEFLYVSSTIISVSSWIARLLTPDNI